MARMTAFICRATSSHTLPPYFLSFLPSSEACVHRQAASRGALQETLTSQMMDLLICVVIYLATSLHLQTNRNQYLFI